MNGNVISVNPPNQTVTATVYDAEDRINSQTETVYDDLGRPQHHKRNGQRLITNEHDLNNKTAIIDAVGNRTA